MSERELASAADELNALVRAVTTLGFVWQVDYQDDDGPPVYRLSRPKLVLYGGEETPDEVIIAD